MATPQEIANQSACMSCVPDWRAAMLYLWSNGVTPQEIATNARCFTCLPDFQSAMLYLLARIAGVTDPSAIADQAKCFQCIPNQRDALLFLANTIATNGIGGTCPQDMQVSWTPTNLKLGEMYGYGVADAGATDFVGITSITFRGATTQTGIIVRAKSALTSLSFPNLLTQPVGTFRAGGNSVMTTFSAPVMTVANILQIDSNVSLTSLVLTALTTITNQMLITGNTTLPIISLPALTSCSGVLTATGNTLLVTLSMPLLVTLGGTLTLTTDPALADLVLTNYVPSNGRVHTITGAALTQASVDQLLARCVANAAYVTGTINTSGGTSSAPGVQGQLDKSALILRGVTVTTN